MSENDCDPQKRYANYWYSHSWWWRVRQRVEWIADAVYSAIRGRPGPEARLIGWVNKHPPENNIVVKVTDVEQRVDEHGAYLFIVRMEKVDDEDTR